MNVAFVFGTRPEAIKLAPIILEWKRRNYPCAIISTGQHREMVSGILEWFGLTPTVNLDVMTPNQTLSELSAQCLIKLQSIFGANRYDLVVVQGDTTTALMSAIGSFYNKIPVAHVEAGLRTHDKYSPWPEEMNRVLITRLAELHFAPTHKNARQLIGEGVNANAVHVTGNSVIDALMVSIKKIRDMHDEREFHFLPSSGRRLVLITAHRRENYGEPIRSIASAINTLSIRFPDTDFVLPMHRNPNIRESLISILGNRQDNIHLIESLDYPNFIRLMDRSTIILTDSGGIQEEAPSLHKPVLVIRESTERTEAVESGCVKVIGTNAQIIIQEVSMLLTKPSAYDEFIGKANPYGDGTASVRIIDVMTDYLKSRA